MSRLLAGVRYRVPFALLLPEHQLRVVRALFAADRATAAGWEHQAPAAAGAAGTSLWHISEWFTGRGENHAAIRQVSKLASDGPAPGERVLIRGSS